MDAVKSRQWSTSTLEEGLALLEASSPSTLVASMAAHSGVPASPGIKNKIQVGGCSCSNGCFFKWNLRQDLEIQLEAIRARKLLRGKGSGRQLPEACQQLTGYLARDKVSCLKVCVECQGLWPYEIDLEWGPSGLSMMV